jgi:MscS family membrane protein
MADAALVRSRDFVARTWGRHCAAVCTLLLVLSTTTSAQVSGAPTPGKAATAARDPLGRDSPFGTVTSFSTAAQRGELALAAQFLQAGGRSEQQLETLARELNDLLDRYYTQPLNAMSRSASGDLADGLAPDRERLPLVIGDTSADLFLTRVSEPGGGSIWVFSSDSLARIPKLQRSQQATWLERVMPETLLEQSYFGLSLAQWTLWTASIFGPILVLWPLTALVTAMGRQRIQDVTRRAVFLSGWNSLRWPLVIGLTLAIHLSAIRVVGFSLTSRLTYARFGLAIAILTVAMLLWRLISIACRQARLMALRRGRSDTRSLIALGERVVKVFVALLAVFGLLSVAGLDLTTALAGVGIVGVALALGAQKTVENLLGGIFILTDHALAVGDYCRLSDREGWVEDITLRSIRLRTVEQTLLSVPAGLLAQGSIENYSTRGKIPLKSVLLLRYGTTGEQLHAVLEGARQLLIGHPSLEKDSARIRLISFGAQAIELELFAFVTTSDYPKFLEVREGILLQIAQIIESSGSAFAVPTQFIYMRPETDRHLAPVGQTARGTVTQADLIHS